MTLRQWPLTAILLALAQAGPGQTTSSWRVYDAADGVPASPCTSVSVSPGGRILARYSAPPSIAVLDGYRVKVMHLPASFEAGIAQTPAGQIWIATASGLAEFKNGKWSPYAVPEIAVAFHAPAPRRITRLPMYAPRQDHVVFVLPDVLMEFNAEDPGNPETRVLLKSSQAHIGRFTGMSVARRGGLWISGERGLVETKRSVSSSLQPKDWLEFVLPQALRIGNLHAPEENDEGIVTLVGRSLTNRASVVATFDGQHWKADGFRGSGRILRAWRGPEGSRWLVTTHSLLERASGASGFVRDRQLSAKRIFDAAVVPDRTFWLATSAGLFHYTPPIWRSVPLPAASNAPVRSITADFEGGLWVIANGRLHSLRNGSWSDYALPKAAVTGSPAKLELFALHDGMLLLSAGGQVFRFHPGQGVFEAVPMRQSGNRAAVLGAFPDGKVCVQSWKPGAPAAPDLKLFDGTRFSPLPGAPAPAQFPGAFSTMLVARNGDLWLAGESGIAWRHDNRWQIFPLSQSTVSEAVISFAETTDGRIWCATRSQVWEFDGRNWSLAQIGLDHANAMIRTADGSVWIGDRHGLHRYFEQAWVENGTEEGLADNVVLSIFEDLRGRVWAGTARGLSLYYPQADLDPPLTFIAEPRDRQVSFREGATVRLKFGGEDKWKFTPRDRLLFSYRLDERDWSPFRQATNVSFTDLAPGQHYFQVRAMDRNGNVDPRPALLAFAVTVPWFKETRLMIIAIAGAAAALFFALLAFNRHRQLLRSYAEVERKVADRTRELEIANRQLFHSQKMNALGTLAAGIAHDFNNILSIIKGSAQIIEENLHDPEKTRIRLDRIKTVVGQGGELVRAMLGFSRSSEETPAPCDVNDVVEDTVKLLGDRFLREVEIQFERNPGVPRIPVAKDFVQQILLNFIFNAAEAMSERKKVVITVRQVEAVPPGSVLVPAAAPACVAISVRDVGCGISAENLPRIFEPFFTTKSMSARRGTGLGLSMAYELAAQMEAGLSVESAPGQGSTFTLFLPVKTAKS